MKKAHYYFFITAAVVYFSVLTLLLSGCGKEIKDPYTLLKMSVDQALEKSNWQKSRELAEEALKLDPENNDALIMYSLTLDQNGEQAEAVKKLRKVIKSDPDNFLAQLSIGRILYSMHDFEGAYEYLSNAYNLKPDNLFALVIFSQCSLKLLAQNTDELLKKLSSTETYADKPVVYNELGVYYAETGNLKAAIRNFVDAYKLSPKKPVIVLNLAILCDNYMRQYEKAGFFYRKFIELTNNNPAYNKQREIVNKRLRTI